MILKIYSSDAMDWININEKLPAILETVLIFSGRVTVGYLVGQGDVLFYSYEFNDYESDVTFWMPMPNGPE